ncbi:MAG: ribonuclease III [Rhodospirillales bacterium]|nr:ribonuclease III [Alphaproteobacteria bacterium]MCB9986855.1 ribonuclease III [Rhodospirillales bacterium]USO08383.1 MAG: ribonuclease III [Rhodospirillales bacterium]
MTGAGATLQTRLGYAFRDPSLLDLALTHASAPSAVDGPDYERLEFLGDRVLGLIVAERLYALYPHEPEGDLSKRHTALVRAETLAAIARRIDIGAAMRLSDAEKAAGGAHNENILSDMLEAVIGAIFLDGGLDAARAALNPLLDADIAAMPAPPRDAKTALQEWAQAHGLGLPEYILVERAGPDHAPSFTLAVKLADGRTAQGTGPSKRAAEKQAAQSLLELVEDRT